MLTNSIKFMMSLHSKRLVKSAMLLRPQHNRNIHLHLATVQKYVRMTQKPQPLSYKIHHFSENVSMSIPHPKALGLLEQLPFSIQRTFTGNLPVYLEYRNQRKVKKTVLRKVTGDMEKLANEIRKVVSNAEVRVKVGYIEIPGVHRESVNMLLLRLGF